MGNVSALSKAMVDDALYNTLDIKEAAILHKYLTAMGRQIAAGDAGKFFCEQEYATRSSNDDFCCVQKLRVLFQLSFW